MRSFTNTHSVLVRAELGRVFPEVLRWGEAPWWPKGCPMQFVRTTPAGAVDKGTRYTQKVLLPFAPSWSVEVEEVTPASITRRFLNGMFAGSETVSVRSVEAGVEVVYEMRYCLNGAMNAVLWPLVFRRMHDANIEAILASLKNYSEDESLNR
jgi:hypothetical protein